MSCKKSLKPAQRRALVGYVQVAYKISQQRACSTLRCNRTVMCMHIDSRSTRCACDAHARDHVGGNELGKPTLTCSFAARRLACESQTHTANLSLGWALFTLQMISQKRINRHTQRNYQGNSRKGGAWTSWLINCMMVKDQGADDCRSTHS